MYQEVMDHAVRAEELGYDSFWLTEHHFWYDGYCPSILPVLAAVARRTSRIGIGTGCLLLALHDPLRDAEDIAFLDVISNGRLILGLAPGYRPEEFAGLGPDHKTKGSRLYEAIEVLKKAFAEERFSHAGKFFRYEQLRLVPKPLQKPHPPIWVGAGWSPAQARNIGRRGLAYWAGPAIDFDRVRALTGEYRRAAEEAGVRRESIKLAVFRDVCIAETREEAERIMEEDLLPMYEEQYVSYGYILDESGGRRRDLIRNHPLFQEILRSFVVGTPAQVIREIEHYREIGIEYFMPRIMLVSLNRDRIVRQMELFAREVIPHFKRQRTDTR
jgi:alkanesulfonate monooxygenase SsuD/methylene tetrahydromethanopterin reductase-like flavin-dependent oxidoreductase (luciferase family)